MTVTDWAPLAETDPVPGDPMAVRRLAARHQLAAEQVGERAAALRRVAHGVAAWSGPAAGAFQARVGRLPEDLVAVGERFQRVARALQEFAPVLESSQRQARAALAAARTAQAAAQATPAIRSGSPDRPLASHVVGPFAGPLDIRPEDSADAELDRARRQLALACEERDRAAARCARAISAAAHDRLRNPSGWHRLLGAVSAWAGVCSAWLGIASLVLCWVPGLGAVLGAASLTLALVQLAADASLAASGDAGWGGAAVDLLGVVPVGRAARLGSVMTRGRALQQGARHAEGATRAVAVTGRGLERLSATTVRFERSRGVHGLAQLVTARPGSDLGVATGHLASAVRSARRARSLGELVRSPGGVLDEIARARGQGPRAVAWLSGGHAADLAQATVGVPFAPPTGPAW